MDALTLFGLLAVTLMLLCYALESRGPGFVLGFAAACALGSIYGFLQGAWPFGIVEAVWCVVALARWRDRAALPAAQAEQAPPDGTTTTPGPLRPPTRPGMERRGYARR